MGWVKEVQVALREICRVDVGQVCRVLDLFDNEAVFVLFCASGPFWRESGVEVWMCWRK